MDAQSDILAVEEKIGLASLPANVRDGLTKSASTGQIVKVESLMRLTKLVALHRVR
jgi:hypothetical protein